MRLMIAIAGLALAAAPVHAAGIKVGEPAPETTMTLANGQKVALSSLRGQVVVLNYWATWCGPCKVELPLLDRYFRVQGKHGLRVFAVTTEDSLPQSVLKPLFGALAIDPVRRIGGKYKDFDAVPTNIIIDRAGVVRYAKSGALTIGSMNELIVPLLREKAPAN